MMFSLLVLLVAGSKHACTRFSNSENCDSDINCMWTDSCQQNTCSNNVQDACLQSEHCSWNTCSNECEPTSRVTTECGKNKNFCTVQIDGKYFSRDMCTATPGCMWDMCYNQCNQAFLVPVQCQEECIDQLTEPSCIEASGCGWNACDGTCQKEDIVPKDCAQKLGAPAYNPGTYGRATMRYDPKTGRMYRPYQKRPMVLTHKVWTWVLALPPVCLIIFFIGFYFPQDICDSSDADMYGGDYVEEGELPSMHHHSQYSNLEPLKLQPPISDISSSTLHTMLSSKAASQTRNFNGTNSNPALHPAQYRGPSKSRILYQNTRHVETSRSISLDRERFGPSKRAPFSPPSPVSDIEGGYDYHYNYVPPTNRDSKKRKTEAM